MARITLGIGCSHTPQLHTPVEQWKIRARRDVADGLPFWYHGERMVYADLLEKRKHLQLDIDGAERERRLAAATRGLLQLKDVCDNARPDAIVIFGNDQAEMFLDDLKPAFTVTGSESYQTRPRTAVQKSRLPPGIELSDHGHLPERGSRQYPGYPQLAEHIAGELMLAEFDIAWASRQVVARAENSQTSGLPHAYGFIFKQLFGDTPPPSVLVDINTLYAPNQPSAKRCYDFGKAVGRALASWPDNQSIGVIASGGLSHFVVDEEFDRDIMSAMASNRFDHLLNYSEAYYQAGSSEIKSWLAAGGAMQGANLTGSVVDYQALYRTPAGTGSSAAFMVWE